VHLGAEGGVHHDPPVTEFVPEPLDHQQLVVRQSSDRLPLLGEVAKQVVSGPFIESGRDDPLARPGSVRAGDFPDERAHRPSQFSRTPGRIPLPERQPGRLPGGGGHEHPIVGDLLDPPRGGAQGEHVTHPRLVHHLFVEFADAASRTLSAGEEDPVQAAVGNGAARGHRQPLRAAASAQGVGHPIPGQAWTQFSELVGRVPPAQHVEDRLQHRPGQPTERGCPAREREQVVDRPLVQGDHGHHLLGEDVERIGGHPQRLDRPGPHPFGDHRRLHEVAAKLREQDAPRHRAHLVAGPADPLQARGHRRRRLHLDDQIDRPHVDAQLQARRRDHRGQPSRLEIFLGLESLLAAHRSVVRPRQDGWGATADRRLRHHLGGGSRRRDSEAGCGQGRVRRGRRTAFAPCRDRAVVAAWCRVRGLGLAFASSRVRGL